MGKGINETYIKESIEKIKEDNSDQDFFSGIKICKKKRIGPARAEDNRPLFYKKDISLLARNGFDFGTSKRIMDIDQSEYLKIIKLLWFLFFFFFQVVNYISYMVFNKYKN